MIYLSFSLLLLLLLLHPFLTLNYFSTFPYPTGRQVCQISGDCDFLLYCAYQFILNLLDKFLFLFPMELPFKQVHFR